jgi:hypothetical protein
LFEEPQRLFRRPATLLSRFECIDEAPPGMGDASKMVALASVRQAV